VASDVRKKYAKYLTGISSNAVFIHILVNTPTKVKNVPGNEGVKGQYLLKRVEKIKMSWTTVHAKYTSKRTKS
jgi:hypothetical protein